MIFPGCVCGLGIPHIVIILLRNRGPIVPGNEVQVFVQSVQEKEQQLGRILLVVADEERVDSADGVFECPRGYMLEILVPKSADDRSELYRQFAFAPEF